MLDKIYFIIPTINGEICAIPIITLSLDYDLGEVTVYEIDLKTLYVKEIKDF